ncbi:PREDICTED: LOW QUALITY PROTEIN: endogenous retrovirus group K member 9 Pol protein-like [Dipodomys ordii]|uniref:human endogenous retrovirus K endopeptidase n=1 Tax=Dipodomys ordii TaxID=10020 RepID=A0A1S3GBH0_DIPOR|nr:PREDICTED: LOW QUALITY PROTEIN: endogenous retrovirus group K member 9 Pol protein-like [Dipodomys ordii]
MIQEHYDASGPEKTPVDAFTLWNLVRACLDPRHEQIKFNQLIGKVEQGTESRPAPGAHTAAQKKSNKLIKVESIESENEKKSDGSDAEEKSDDSDTEEKIYDEPTEDRTVHFEEMLNSVIKKLSQIEAMLQSTRSAQPSRPRPLKLSSPPNDEFPLGTGAICPPRRSALQLSLAQAAQRGEDISGFHLFPVMEDQNQQRTRQPIQFKQIRDLKNACAQYGPTAPFTQVILETLSTDALCPNDWKQLARACLSGGDYLLWKSEFVEQCQATAEVNRANNIPTTFAELAGEGAYNDIHTQLNYPVGAYAQINAAAKRAWKKLPNSNKTEDLSKIRQGPDEPYQDFVSRLLEATGHLIQDGDASMVLVQQLAYENANAACQAAIRPFRKKGGITDYIRLCADIGPSYMQGLTLAAALQGQTITEFLRTPRGDKNGGRRPRVAGPPGSCFSCGQMGHLITQCPNQKKGAKLRKCPRCNKGRHWARDCKSTFDSAGRPILENWQRGQPLVPQQKNRGSPILFTASSLPAGNQQQQQQTVSSLLRATPGSAGLDLCSSTYTVLTPEMGVQALPTGIVGPLPKGSVGLLLGRSSSALRGLHITPGVIDQDYTGEIKIMASAPTGVISISAGQRIAQLVLVPLISVGNSVTSAPRGTKNFGASDVFWIQNIKQGRPELIIYIQEKPFQGVLDTGADVSVIAKKYWPSHWPLTASLTSLQGIGHATDPQQSSAILNWKDDEGHSGTFQPYVLDHLPINLWGRDIMEKMGVYLFSPNDVVTLQLLDQGLLPSGGLGIGQQGIREPIQPQPRPNRQGLGYF